MPQRRNQQPKSLPLISVIVPIYKVEKYLKRCLDSILAQEYKNLQIILVDDGSPDKCPEICDKYAEQDSRITVIHKVNGGLSDARNAGIDVVKGEYIAFVDSDDYIDRGFVSTLYDLMQKYDADISICEYIEEFENSNEIRTRSSANGEVVLTNIEAMADTLVGHKYGHVYVWNKLYKTSIFTDSGIRFPKGKMFEDAFVIYKLFYYANKIAYSDQARYHYLKRPVNVTGKIDGPIRRHAKMELLGEMDLFIHDHNLPLTRELDACYLRINLHYVGIVVDSGKIDKPTWMELRTNITSKFPKCLTNKNLTSFQKVATFLVWTGWFPYLLVNRTLRSIGFKKKPRD